MSCSRAASLLCGGAVLLLFIAVVRGAPVVSGGSGEVWATGNGPDDEDSLAFDDSRLGAGHPSEIAGESQAGGASVVPPGGEAPGAAKDSEAPKTESDLETPQPTAFDSSSAASSSSASTSSASTTELQQISSQPSNPSAPTSIEPPGSSASTATTAGTTSSPTRPASTSATTTSTTSPPTTAVTSTGGISQPIVVIADIGVCDSSAPAEVARIVERMPGRVLAVGDIAYPVGSVEDFRNCFAVPFAASLDRIVPIVGNHEYDTPGAAGFKEYFGIQSTYYTQMIGGWKLIVLDSECDFVGGCGAADPQQRWLAAELASAPLCSIVATHRPHHTSSANYDNEARADAIHDIAIAGGADLVLTGHAHLFEHLVFGQTHQFVVGTGGAGLRQPGSIRPESKKVLSEHGALAMELTSKGFSWRFSNTTGVDRYSGSGQCS